MLLHKGVLRQTQKTREVYPSRQRVVQRLVDEWLVWLDASQLPNNLPFNIKN